MKGSSSKCIALKTDVLQDRNIYCFAGASVHLSLSPEIIQAGAVKGLSVSGGRNTFLFPGRLPSDAERCLLCVR